jgi:two-component system, NarL family, response regulator LiaR
MNPIRVFIVDDHNLFRCGVTTVLQNEPQFECVGEADSGLEAVRRAPETRADLVLLDMNMPGMSGVAAMAALRELLPRARFVLITCTLEAAELRRAYAAGASCVLHKSASPQELVTVLQAAHRGQAVYSPTVADAMSAHPDSHELGADLTQRERKLLSLMACGLPNREISQRLDIAMPTVKFHVTNILSKLNADNRTSAVLAALKHNLVALDQA